MVKLDDSQKSLTISIDDATPPIKNLLMTFSILENNNLSELQVSTELEQTLENAKMIEGILDMICNGLKQFHE
ncbi:MAG: hypothetical protein ACRBB5_05740 [Nitrosopumilus sp.]